MSKNILQIDSGAGVQNSESRNMTRAFVAQWLHAHADYELTVRDITARPLPHLDAVMLNGLFAMPDARTAAMQAAVERVDALVTEFVRAHVIVFGVPMYNFGIPSTLKAYIDHIAQAGRTFKYTEQGPVGLAGDKQVFVLSARGGVYEDSPMDHQESYLRTIFGFLGIGDIQFIHAQGLHMGDDARASALVQAHECIRRLAA